MDGELKALKYFKMQKALKRRFCAIFQGFFVAGARGLEPRTPGFGDQCTANCTIPLCEFFMNFSGV